MKQYNTHTGFTLIELLVSITIFAIMMISVMSIFLFSSQMSTKVELNRVMQENLKNVIEDIAENVRKKGIEGVLINTGVDACNSASGSLVIGTKLCLNDDTEYSIGTKTGPDMTPWERVTDIVGACGDIEDICYILKKDPGGEYYPLTNSFIHFENISFIVTNTDIPKLTIQITARPAYKKGLSSEIIKNSYTYIQTTLSERFIETR